MARYSEVILDHAESPSNVGWLANADAEATTGAPGRPPYMAMYFRIHDGIVVEVKYRTFGCAPAIGTGSVLTEMITGRSVQECLAVSEEQLGDALGGVPHGTAWYTSLALSTMRKALSEYQDG